MTELTKLDICKKIARIKHVDCYEEDGALHYRDGRGVFDPASDYSMILSLMIEHKVHYDPVQCHVFIMNDWPMNQTRHKYKDEDEIPHAVLLAIIEVYSE